MSIKRNILSAAVVSMLILLTPLTSDAANRFVSPTGFDGTNTCKDRLKPCRTLGHAVAMAVNGDVIRLAAGEYTEANVVVNKRLTIRGAGKAATFLQAGPYVGWWYYPGPEVNEINRVMYVTAEANITIYDVSLRYGCAYDDTGHALYNKGETALINTTVDGVADDCTSDDSYLDASAGIYNSGTLQLDHSIVSGYNWGIYNVGELEMSSSEVVWSGEGISNETGAVAIINDSRIENNGRYDEGTGGISNGGSMTIERTTVGDNTGHTGAINNSGVMTIGESLIARNYGRYSGIVLNRGDLFLRNTTLSGNRSDYEFGAIWNTGTLTVMFATIAYNSHSSVDGTYWGSGHFAALSNRGVAMVMSSILFGNTSDGEPSDCSTTTTIDAPVPSLRAPIQSYGNNIFGEISGCEIQVALWDTDLIGVDPRLEPLSFNGGPTETHGFSWGPAMQGTWPGGSGCEIPFDHNGRTFPGIKVDQRGDPRPQNFLCDIGAVELNMEDFRPVTECVETNGDGTYTAVFGYVNTRQTIEISSGWNNAFSPTPFNRGQPTVFPQSLFSKRVLAVVFDGKPLTWTLNYEGVARKATASSASPSCSPSNGATLKVEVSPILECVTDNLNGTFNAHFGYENQNAFNVYAPIGAQNRFSPGSAGQAQPTIFLPGRHKGVFNSTWEGGPLTWNLTQSGAEVSSSSPACQQVTPTFDCVSKNADGSFTGSFGYENPNEFPVFLKKGTPANRFVPIWAPQPPLFEPGAFRNSFKVKWNGKPITWELNGLSVVASRNSPRCVSQNLADADGVAPVLEELPLEFALGNSYPNPFNPETTIPFAVPEASHVSVYVYDVLGREIARLADETFNAGTHELRWDAGSVPAGMYFIRMKAAEMEFLRTVMLVK